MAPRGRFTLVARPCVSRCRKAAHARLIVVEPYRERSNPDFVAQGTGARVLVLPAMPEGDAPDYIQLIDGNVQKVASALREAKKAT